MNAPRLQIAKFAQIGNLDLTFGDLTVLVGAQATGKSLALQWLKLAVDEMQITDALHEAGFSLRTPEDAVDAYFGEGMRGAWRTETTVVFNGRRVRPETLARKTVRNGPSVLASMFFVPAHRALLLSEGWPAPFMKLGADTPVVARLFSQALYERLSRPRTTTVFPQERVLVKEIRERIDETMFHGGKINLQTQGLRRRLELQFGNTGVPFMTWTAGQREFAPLLLGLYSVLPERRLRKVEGLEWVVVEEPEMGLHPRAIATVMILVLDLLWRGYRVVLSTHSPLVIDTLWAIRQFQLAKGDPRILAHALELNSQASLMKVEAAIGKLLKVYYLSYQKVEDGSQCVTAQDISELRTDAEGEAERDWGGLTFYGTKLSEAVSRIPEVDAP